MRQTTEIICDINNVKERIKELKMQKEDLMKELKEAAAAKFEKQMNVKRGDTIKTKMSGTTYFYDGFIESYGSMAIICHPAKKDGTASRAIRHMWPGDFGFDIEK